MGRWSFLLPLLVVTSGCAGMSPATTEPAKPQLSEKAEACFDAANASTDEGSTPATVVVCTEAIVEKPASPAVMAGLLVARGIAYRDGGDFAEALADLDEALRLRPDYVSAANMRAWTFREMGDYAAAEEAYSQTLKDEALKSQVAENGAIWQAFLSRCVVRQDLGYFNLSTGDCEVALQGRRDEDSLYFAARAYTGTGRCADAVPLLEEALSLEPVRPRVYRDLGYAFGCIGNKQRALTILDDGIERFPSDQELKITRRWAASL